MAPRVFRAGNNKVIEGGGGKADETVLDSSKNKKSRKLTCMLNIGSIKELNFLIPNAKKVFNHLQLAFIKALILLHFDLESYIQIKINILGYSIDRMLSQLNLNSDAPLNDLNLKSDFGQWHSIVYFSKKMITAET